MRSTYCPLLVLIGFFVLGFTGLNAQRDWSVPFRSEQTFIENQGQFDRAGGAGVLYGIDHGFAWQVFFTPQGAKYVSRKGGRPGEGRHLFHNTPTVTTEIMQEWVGGNPNVEVRASGQRPDYFTYAYEVGEGFEALDRVLGHDSLRYVGLYNGVDLIYTCPAQGGVKYTLELAAGADAGLIKLRYSGSTVRLMGDGDIHLETVLGDLIDHKPTARYLDGAMEVIPCAFAVNGNEVSFQLGSYDAGRRVEIDPWTVNPAFPLFNRAFEVDADAAGNVYAFGGGMGYQLKKYNSAGTLQWTHVSPWDTSNSWFGELLTMPSGDCFITAGSAAKLRRLTTAGATTFTNNGPFLNLDEYWNLTLNCDNTQLIAGGTRIVGFVSPQGHVFNLNMTNGNQMAGSPINVNPTGMNEVRALYRGANGLLYAMANNNLIALATNFSIIYSVSHGYTLPYNSPAYRANSVQGVNAIDANANFVYTSNGAVIHRHDVGTGASLGSVAVPGGGYTGGFFGTGATNSGLVLDNCGDVYVGSSNQVIKYNATLVQQATVATTGAVYDVVVAPGGVVIWGGNGFVTSNTSLAPCIPQVVICPVLAVELAYWDVVCEENAGKAHWSAEVEDPGVGYVVEQSGDGEHWAVVGSRAGSGAGVEHVMELPGAPLGTQYRLRMVDVQGQSDFSHVLQLQECGLPPVVRSWPTYTQDRVNLSFYSMAVGMCRVEVLSPLGAKVMEAEKAVVAGDNVVYLLLDELAGGMYFLKVYGVDGTVVGEVQKVVKE